MRRLPESSGVLGRALRKSLAWGRRLAFLATTGWVPKRGADTGTVLVVQPGSGPHRHSNHLEAVIATVNKLTGYEMEFLACDGGIRACGFRMGVEERPEDPVPRRWERQCGGCTFELRTRFGSLARKWQYVSRLITPADRREAAAQLENFLGTCSVEEIINMETRGVNVGRDVWMSLQRYLLLGEPKTVVVTRESLVYSYMESGVLYALAMDRLFNERTYRFLVSNETCYVDWGIPVKFALKHGIPTLLQTHFYPGPQLLVLKAVKNESDLKALPYQPSPADFKRLVEHPATLTALEKQGELALRRFMTQHGSDPAKSNATLNEFFSSGRPNVVIFTHLCWDSSLAYGDSLFVGYRDWLANTLQVASLIQDVHWVIKVHPAEDPSNTSRHYNTYTLLTELLEEYRLGSAAVMGHDVPLRTIDLLPRMTAGITNHGTVAAEISAHGVPCIVASRVGYAELGFCHAPQTRDEYRELLERVGTLPRLPDSQRRLARAYAGLMFEPERLFDVSGAFRRADSSEYWRSRRRFESWLTDNKAKDGVMSACLGALDLGAPHNRDLSSVKAAGSGAPDDGAKCSWIRSV